MIGSLHKAVSTDLGMRSLTPKRPE